MTLVPKIISKEWNLTVYSSLEESQYLINNFIFLEYKIQYFFIASLTDATVKFL